MQRTPEINSEASGRTTCPVCGHTFSNGGFPKHLRRHITVDARNINSPGWWRGWVQGYISGVREGRLQMQAELRNQFISVESKK